MTNVNQALASEGVKADIVPMFDLPMRSPYWSVRSESLPEKPLEYRGSGDVWKYYLNKLGGSEEEKKALTFHPDFKKFYEQECKLLALPIATLAEKVLFLHDLILQRVYLSSSEAASLLDKSIIAFANIAIIKARRERMTLIF